MDESRITGILCRDTRSNLHFIPGTWIGRKNFVTAKLLCRQEYFRGRSPFVRGVVKFSGDPQSENGVRAGIRTRRQTYRKSVKKKKKYTVERGVTLIRIFGDETCGFARHACFYSFFRVAFENIPPRKESTE